MSPRKDLKAQTDQVIYVPEITVPQGYDPEKDTNGYMNPVMLAYFYELLSTERTEILDEMHKMRASFTEAGTARHADPIDRAAHQRELSQTQQSWERRKDLLPKITGLLQEIEENGANSEYGYSDISGDEIGIGRLKAKPWATKTADEQATIERRKKQYGKDAPARHR